MSSDAGSDDQVLENWEDDSVPENWEEASVGDDDEGAGAVPDSSAASAAADPSTAPKAAPARRKLRKVGTGAVYEEDPWAAGQFERLQHEYDTANTVHKEYNDGQDLKPPFLLEKVTKGNADDYIRQLASSFRSATSTGLGYGPVVDALKRVLDAGTTALVLSDLEQVVASLERAKSEAESREAHAREAKAAEKVAKAAAKKVAEEKKAAEDAAVAAAAAEAAARAEEEAKKLAAVAEMDDEDFM